MKLPLFFTTLIILLSSTAQADDFIEAIKKKFIPELNDPKICKKVVI
jgi:hypothetical protein